MKTTIAVQIVELAGNHPEGFLSKKFGTALREAIAAEIASEYPEATIDVVVDTQMRTSGCTPVQNVYVDGDDEREIADRVDVIVEYACQRFGEKCMQDDEYFE